MTAEEIRDTQAALGMSQAELAELIGVGTRTVNRWCSEGASDATPAVKLLRLLNARPRLAGELERLP